MDNKEFKIYALIELMGRQRIAGEVTERVIAGTGFLEVNVPETSHNPAFTRFVSPSSVYAINPVDERTCSMYAENLRVKPIESWDIEKFMAKANEQKLLRQAEEVEEEKEETYD